MPAITINIKGKEFVFETTTGPRAYCRDVFPNGERLYIVRDFKDTVWIDRKHGNFDLYCDIVVDDGIRLNKNAWWREICDFWKKIPEECPHDEKIWKRCETRCCEWNECVLCGSREYIKWEKPNKWMFDEKHECPQCAGPLSGEYDFFGTEFFECSECNIRIPRQLINSDWPYKQFVKSGQLFQQEDGDIIMIVGDFHRGFSNEWSNERRYFLLSCEHWSYESGKNAKGEWAAFLTTMELADTLRKMKAVPVTDKKIAVI